MAVLDSVENFVRVTTTESVDSTQTSVTVSNSSNFPTDSHNCVVWDADNHPRPDQDPDVEIIRVTAVDTSTDTLTISRGQESTSATSHPNGSAVAVAPTAKMFTDIDSELQSIASSGVDTRSAVNDLFIQNAEQDFELGLSLLEFDDGQYEVFANDSNIASSTGLDLVLGSSIDGNGYAAIDTAVQGSIGPETDRFDSSGEIADVRIDDTNGFSLSRAGEIVYKWDIGTMSQIEQVNLGAEPLYITPTALDIDQSNVYVGTLGGNIRKHSRSDLTYQDENITQLHNNKVKSITIDGDFAYSASFAQILKWDTETMTVQDTFTGGGDFVHDIAVDPQHIYVAFGENDNNVVRKLDKDTLSVQDTFTGHSVGDVRGVVVDGQSGFSVSSGGSIRKWDKETMTEQGSSAGGGRTLVFGNDGIFIYVGGGGGINAVNKNDLTSEASFIDPDPTISLAVTDDFLFAGGEFNNDVRKVENTLSYILQGNVQHTFQDLGFVPEQAVINDDLRQPLPTNADVYYKIEDADGNSQTIQRSGVDTTVDLTGFTSSEVSTTALIERDDATVDSPQLDSWALYLRGA